jgi:FtsP/CotA-like multicopper oxidase with cupredoxin domain
MHISGISRRQFLIDVGLVVSAVALPARAQDDKFSVIRARPGFAHLRGPDQKPTAIWGYDGIVPGPILRVRRGEEVKVRLVNDLPEPTAVHWHGLRLPNAMDGVPHLTQAPIASGQSFDYRFKAVDAGTYWYHSHLYTSEQIERGLYGALIVDESERIDVDQDILLVIDDWRLLADGSLDEASFRSFHDAAHAGRIGRHLTVNSAPSLDIPVRANERLRLRVVNAANARLITLRVDRHAARVMAIDGQPAEPFFARNSQVTLGPGNRVDFFIDAMLEPGANAAIMVQNFGVEVALARLVYAASSARPARPDPTALPPNPLPERMAFKNAFRVDVPLEGGAMSQLMMRGRQQEIPGHGIDPRARIWTMAGSASSGHHGPPMFSVTRGRVVMLGFVNNSAFPHAMHVHGHHFRLLDKNDDGWKPYWLDTLVVPPRETARIAFVADNPGKWMLHCHMLEHQETGMAAWFEVT